MLPGTKLLDDLILVRGTHVAPDEQEDEHYDRTCESGDSRADYLCISCSEESNYSSDEWSPHQVCRKSQSVSEKPETKNYWSTTHLSCHGAFEAQQTIERVSKYLLTKY